MDAPGKRRPARTTSPARRAVLVTMATRDRAVSGGGGPRRRRRANPNSGAMVTMGGGGERGKKIEHKDLGCPKRTANEA